MSKPTAHVAARRSVLLLHLGHQWYVNVADYMIVIISTLCSTQIQLIQFFAISIFNQSEALNIFMRD